MRPELAGKMDADENSALAKQAEHLIKAYVVTRKAVSATQLAAYSRKFLPSYMVPWSFDRITAVPRTSTGKIDYQALKQLGNGSGHAGYHRPGQALHH